MKARQDCGKGSSRREFLQRSSGALLGAALAGGLAARSYAGEDNTIKIALVGCGGRGTGAAAEALSTKGPTKLVAMADVFDDRLDASLQALRGQVRQAGRRAAGPAVRRPGRLQEGDRRDRPGRRGLLATPPAFRPIHVEYAVAKGCHVFMEKSFAVDAPGIRRVLKAGEEATKKNLKVAGGLMSRHYKPLEEAVEQIHDGLIGDVITCWAYREHGPVGFAPKPAGDERTGPPDPQLLATSPGSTAASSWTG